MMLSPATSTVSEKSFDSYAYEVLWDETQTALHAKVGEATYNSWIAPLVYRDFSAGRFVIAAPTRFIRDWVRNTFGKEILEILQEKFAPVLTLDIVVQEGHKAPCLESSGGGTRIIKT